MDEMDTQLIAALRQDGRASVSELASRLSMSRTTVRARIERMQARGDIVGFSVVMKADVADSPVRGLMMVQITGAGAHRIIRQVQGMADVTGVHSTSGRWDLIVEIGVPTLETFDDVLNRIRKIDGVAASETSLLLSTKKRA